MIARDAASPPSALSSAMPFSVPSSTLARKTSSPVPMRPVEQIRMSPALTPSSSAAFSAVWCVVWKPNEPVKQFAPPELSTIASTTPSWIDLLRPDDRVRLRAVGREDGGADLERTAVDDDGDVGLAARLEADGDAGGLESLGCGDAHGATPFTVSARALGQAQRDVHGLDRGARGALDEVVDGGDDDDAVRGPVDREPDQRGVRAERRRRCAGTRPRAAAARTSRRRRRPPTRRGSRHPSRRRRSARCVVARMPRAIGTRTGVKEIADALVRGPRLGAPCAGERLADLGDVPVRAADRIRVRAAEDLAREEVASSGSCPHRDGPDREHGDDVGRVDDAGGDAGRETQAHGATRCSRARRCASRPTRCSRCLPPPTRSSGTPYVHGSWKSPP